MSKTDRARKMGIVAILSVVASAMCCFSYVYFELANHEIGSRVFWGIVLFPVIGFILGVFSIIIRVTWLGVIGLLLAIALSGGYIWVVTNIEKGMKRQYQQSRNVEWPAGTPACGSRYTERAGLFSTLPLLAAHQWDLEYWGEGTDMQPNELTGEWLAENVNGNRVYIPGQGISRIPLPTFDDESEYLMPEERVKRWLAAYAGEPIDSIHTLLPKKPEGDVNEKYELKYTNHVELSVEDEYDTYGIGGTLISLYLPDVKLTEAYWLAIRLYLGVQYAEVKWIGVNTTDNTIGVMSFSEGQTLEITANKEKGRIRLTWLYGGC